MLEALIVVAIVVILIAAVWLTRGAKPGPYAGEDAVLEQKTRELDNAFRDRPPPDY